MRNVKSARVHLAIPKNSVFVRKRDNPSASVALNLYGGRTIEQGQVNAIIHMVASSVSNLAPEKVTVVDQSGRLLSSGDMSSDVAMTAKQYDYSRQVEQDYQQRIERLLEPIIGLGKVRATVNADIDFTQQESTEELYNNPDQTVRSEQTSESSRFARETGGVPGALANQPPQGGQLVEGAGGVGGAQEDNEPLNRSRNTVRNYEVDRTIRHSRQSSGSVERLTVAVLVDDRMVVEDGETTRTPLSAEEIARITTLVQQTVGYDEERGDQVNVINASFTPQEEIAELPEPSFMDNKYVQLALKWIWPFLLILVVIFTILKPSISSLTNYTPPRQALPRQESDEEGGYEEGNSAAENVARLAHQGGPIPLPSGHDAKVDFAQSMVQQDAKKVANVVKDWIGSEAS
jgi:flagellar M-ring protein FliF